MCTTLGVVLLAWFWESAIAVKFSIKSVSVSGVRVCVLSRCVTINDILRCVTHLCNSSV